MSSPVHNTDRYEELVISDWEHALTVEERAELQALVEADPDGLDAMERAAAAAHVALIMDPAQASPTMPSDLMNRLKEGADRHFRGPRLAYTRQDHPPPVAANSEPAAPPRSSSGWVWPLALAASIVVAATGWFRPDPPPREIRVEVPVPPPPPPIPPTPSELREALAAQPGTLTRSWTTTEDPYVTEPVDGDVVWSSTAQEGYMAFRGLPANDKAKERYQLWIFDKTRDDRFPVDGGVFDVEQAGETTVVPIEAKLPVGEAVLFAVTLEGPEGVVVSGREHILVLAKP